MTSTARSDWCLVFDPETEPFIDADVAKLLIQDPSLDQQLAVMEFQKSGDFHVERSPGKIVWRTFNYLSPGERVWSHVYLELLGIGPLACTALKTGYSLFKGDTLMLTYTLKWYSGGVSLTLEPVG